MADLSILQMTMLKKLMIALDTQKYRFSKKMAVVRSVVDLKKEFIVDDTLKNDEAIILVDSEAHSKIENNCNIMSDSFTKLTNGIKNMREEDVINTLSAGSVFLSTAELGLKATLISQAAYTDGVFNTADHYIKKFDFEEGSTDSTKNQCKSLDESHSMVREVDVLIEQLELRKPQAEKKLDEKNPTEKPAEKEEDCDKTEEELDDAQKKDEKEDTKSESDNEKEDIKPESDAENKEDSQHESDGEPKDDNESDGEPKDDNESDPELEEEGGISGVIFKRLLKFFKGKVGKWM